jgi:hypothetical protein
MGCSAQERESRGMRARGEIRYTIFRTMKDHQISRQIIRWNGSGAHAAD